jgi:hypothetical protein
MNLPGGKGRPARKANSLTIICEPSRKCGSLDASQPYGPPRPVTRIALPFKGLVFCHYIKLPCKIMAPKLCIFYVIRRNAYISVAMPES